MPDVYKRQVYYTPPRLVFAWVQWGENPGAADDFPALRTLDRLAGFQRIAPQHSPVFFARPLCFHAHAARLRVDAVQVIFCGTVANSRW